MPPKVRTDATKENVYPFDGSVPKIIAAYQKANTSCQVYRDAVVAGNMIISTTGAHFSRNCRSLSTPTLLAMIESLMTLSCSFSNWLINPKS
ncbi:hypothetical protein N7520_005865 [Penicillium odoratum]|uniref:uncharacterized protein n=1 Tax=Penicillium odoratum TaxID=1167516 RepID=UPI00254812BA|nr:uncharacterized protein N7520_005865 [Penicillium odoratum]KAJ5758709.1 hypothetical protein N7520_005865 [Penicillium odoratum]